MRLVKMTNSVMSNNTNYSLGIHLLLGICQRLVPTKHWYTDFSCIFIFFAFFLLFFQFGMKQDDFDPLTACLVSICWLKYSTVV